MKTINVQDAKVRIFFPKKLIFKIINFSMFYLWYCHMSNEIIQSVAYDN
jgi:hypothetical protein